MGNPKLRYESITVLGVAFQIIFFPPTMFFPNLGEFVLGSKFFSTMWLIGSCFFSIVGVVFLTAGICGIGSQYFKNIQSFSSLQPNHAVQLRVKYAKLYGFIAFLGVNFLSIFSAIWYCSEHSAEVTSFFMHTPLAGLLMFIVLLFGGTVLLAVGVCGIAIQHFKKNQSLLAIIVPISIP